jgi:hypothetical protein
MGNLQYSNLPKASYAKKQSILEIKDGSFPNFYFDPGNNIDKVNQWLEAVKISIEWGSYPFSPAILIDPPKAGKSALLKRVIPYVIREKFPQSFVIYMDFMSIPRTSDYAQFGTLFLNYLSKSLNAIGYTSSWKVDNGGVTDTLLKYFQSLNDWLKARSNLCFMLWDEVQRFFQLTHEDGAAVFDTITLHLKFENIVFAVTGSAIVQILNAAINFPSNGTYWISAATVITVTAGTIEEDIAPFLRLEDEEVIGQQMMTLLHHYHNDIPSNILEFLPEKSPALIAYFCELHKGQPTHDRAMKQTIGKLYDKLLHDFKTDSLPILQELCAQSPELFHHFIQIATGSLTIEEIDVELLGPWGPLFYSLMRVDGTERRVCFAGFYGNLLVRSVQYNQAKCSFELRSLNKFIKLPVPALWATVSLVFGMLEMQSVDRRGEANQESDKIFSESGCAISDWEADRSYIYFCGLDLAFHGTDITLVPAPGLNPYLVYLKHIRNAMAHMRSISRIQEIKSHLPLIFPRWIRALLDFCQTQ